MASSKLELAYNNLLLLLEATKTDYLIVGGVAAGLLGEPRFTQDIDLIATIEVKNLRKFLAEAKKIGFVFHQEKVMGTVKRVGTFTMTFGDVRVDIILSSTALEKNAFQRRQRMGLFGEFAFFPTPEDFILLKLIPGRPKDLVDIEAVVLRHGKKLDRTYLERWAQRISDEGENMRVWNVLQKLLRKGSG